MIKKGLSMQYALTSEDRQKWIRNQIAFLKPLVLVVAALYFVPLIGLLGSVGHVVSLADFIPSPETVTAIVLYIVNAAYDLIRKWAGQTA